MYNYSDTVGNKHGNKAITVKVYSIWCYKWLHHLVMGFIRTVQNYNGPENVTLIKYILLYLNR